MTKDIKIRTCSKCSLQYNHYNQKCSFCKVCKREYDRNYHKARPDEIKQRKLKLQKDRLVAARKFLYEYLLNHPCEVCCESDPVVLEFDHLNRTLKENNVSNMVCFSIENLIKEMAKCRVLCANCHRRHTAKQMSWYKFKT
jgi:hypothetical protein